MMTVQNRRWAALEDNPHSSLAVVQESLPINLIATPRQDFIYCRPNETIAVVIERTDAPGYDFLPVLGPGAGDETVLGVLEVAQMRNRFPPEGTVHQYMQPLAEQHLIGADASILTFIRDADQHPFRFVVSGHQISGLVTLSDLQRLPVRAALFAMVTHIEMTMADVIRRRFSQPDGWMNLLSKGRAEKVQKKVADAELADTLVDQLLYTEFCDKVTIIAKSWPSSAEGSPENKRFQRDMKNLQDLRDNLAHANDYAATRDAAKGVCECVRKMDDWIKSLTGWEARQTQAEPKVLQE